MRSIRQRKAFTIIEMVIVIAVIAILATVLVPTISGVIQRANVAADQQFAASLNVQLAMYSVDDPIESESDLRDAINSFYGTEENPDFYATLAPKSGDQGYHYWWNATDEQLVLAKYEDLLGDVAPASEDEPEFSAASLRSLMINGKNYFLMDQAGSDLADLMSGFEKLGEDPSEEGQDYEDLLKKLEDLLDDEDNAELGALTAISEKVEITTIVTAGGAYRYAAIDDIEYIWISPKAGMLKQADVYVYDVYDGNTEATVEKIAGADLATSVMKIELPNGVYVALGGLKAPALDIYTDETTLEYANTTRLHVNTTDVAELLKIYTDCVLVMSNGSEYVWLGDQLYPLPVKLDASGDPTGPSAGTVDGDSMKIDGFEIEFLEVAPNINTGSVFFYDGKLYVAYDKGGVKLSLTDDVTNAMVNWTSDDEGLATVDNLGNVTIKPLRVGSDYEVTVKATYKYDTAIKAEMTIHVVRPTSVALDNGFSIPNTDNTITLTYTGDDTKTFDLLPETLTVGLSQSGIVKMINDCEVKFDDTTKTFFTVSDAGVLTIKPDALIGKTLEQCKQNLTITYQDKTNSTKYIEYTYEVTIKDDSACPIEVNNITSAVKMGQEYLFRVGNEDSFTLGKLFKGTTDKAVTVNIYDADLTNGGVYQAIGSTGKAFNATYTAATGKATWDTGTIKFTGTGVAIIELTVAGKSVELAVEVVDGYNVTAASELKTNANNILLNDIKLASGGTFSLSGDAINHKVFYGNGFKFDITEGKTSGNGIIFLSNADLDNVRIIGNIYTTYASASSKDYYSSAVYIDGSARISNSYIFGTRSNIFMKADLEIVDTVLECARFANINVENGTLTIDGLTTINEPNASNSNVMGLGIVFNDGAASVSMVHVEGELNQYNWVCESDEQYLPSITGLNSFVDELFAATEYVHTIDDVKYVNLGIICLDSDVPVGNVRYPTSYSSKSVNESGYSGFIISIRDDQYTATNTDLTYRSNAYGWTPIKQANTVPTITWTNHSSGSADVTFEKGSSGEFDPNVFSATKYGSTLTHTITVDGEDYTNKKITFTDSQTCTIVYTVKDSKVYDNNGTSTGQTVNYEYTLVVNVTATDPQIKETEFSFANATGTTKVEYSGKTYMVPTFTDSSKFYNIGNGIYAPIVEVQFKDNTSDFTPYYPIFGGVSITWYDSNNTPTTYNSSSSLSALPSGLEWLSNVASVKGGINDWVGYVKHSSYGLCREGSADGSTNSSETGRNVEFSFQGEDGNKYYYYIRFKEPAHTCPSGGCVTPDTLVTLADGTQKEIQYVTYEDELLVWNFNTGSYDVKPASALINHGENYYDVISLEFSDGTVVKVIDQHGFFDAGANKFVFISADNADDYLGHQFVKAEENTYSTVTLVGYSVSTEYTTAYSILSHEYDNAFVEGMLSVTPFPGVDNEAFFGCLVVGENMTYDAEAMQAYIDLHGLYTYEELAVYGVSYDQFVGANLAYLKIIVGEGIVTLEDALRILSEFVPQ